MHTWRSTSRKQQLPARLLEASHRYTNAFRCNDGASYELHRDCCARARCTGASMWLSALFAFSFSLCDQSAFARRQDASIKSTQMPLRRWLLSASLDSLVSELGNQAPQQMPPNNQHSHTQHHHHLHQQVTSRSSVPQNSYTVHEQQLRPLINTQRRLLLPEPFEPPLCPSAAPQPSTPNRWNSERNLHPKSCSMRPQFADPDQELELEHELVSFGDYYQPTGDSGSPPEACYNEFDLDELLAEAGASFTYIRSPPPPQTSTGDHPQHRLDSTASFRSVSAANDWLLGAQQQLQLDKQHQPLTSDSWAHLRTVSSLSAPFFRQPVTPLAAHTSTLSLEPATASNRLNQNCGNSYALSTSGGIALPVLHQQRLGLPSSPLMLRSQHQHQQKPQYQHEQDGQSSHRSHSSNYNSYNHQHQNPHPSKHHQHRHRQSSRHYNSTPAEAENERPAASASKSFQQQFRFDDQSVERLESSAVGEQSDSVMLPLAAVNKMPLSVAEKMRDEASEFVTRQRRLVGKTKVRVRRTLKVKIRKSKPMLGIAIEGGYNVSGQLLPRIVCVHEDGAAYECGKLRASDLILEVNGTQTCNMSHDQIAKTIADAYYIDKRPHIEFLIGESMQV